jgi:hypothetical protein
VSPRRISTKDGGVSAAQVRKVLAAQGALLDGRNLPDRVEVQA